MVTKKPGKNPEKYICISCDFFTCHKNDFKKHCQTIKHKMRKNDNNDNDHNHTYKCSCGKKYKFASGLSRHRQKCTGKTAYFEFLEKKVKETTASQDISNTEAFDEKNDQNKKLTNMCVEMIKKNGELQDQIGKMIPKIGNNTNNFNLNIFLNETCKDAINISEFIESIRVGIKELEYSLNNGIIDSVSSIIINELGQLEIDKRPIHCTDQKRKTLYIKDDDMWEKNNKIAVTKTISDIQNKHISAIKEWEDQHPNWKNDHELTQKYLELIKQSTMPLEDKSENKIINVISKEVELKTNKIV